MNVLFVWSEECQRMSSQGTYIPDSDAYNSVIGTVLIQEHDGRERVTAYGIRILNEA